MMTRSKPSALLSLLLALLLLVTAFPTAAFAADVEDTHIHEETMVVTTEPTEPAAEETAAETEAATEETTPAETEPETSEEEPVPAATSGYIGESAVYWEFNASTGQLIISGSGGCEIFASADDQPWAYLREQITEVWFYDMDALAISDLAYWFEGCTALTMAEIPYTTENVGVHAFADCPNLTDIRFYYYNESVFDIHASAFYVSELTDTIITLISEQQISTHEIVSFDWAAENRTITTRDAYSAVTLADCALSGCTCSSCSWYYSYLNEGSSGHARYVNCSGCSACFWLQDESHSYNSSGYCTYCSYYNSSYDTSVCYHTSTSRSYYTGCDWRQICNSCGAIVNTGTTHGPYTYGSWYYYSSSYHRRSYTCSYGDSGTYYENQSHSTTTTYGQYSDTQHSVNSYCSTCSTTISTSYASHSFTYGSWSNYSSTQHRRTKTCSTCGYSTYEYASHSLSYGSWSSYDSSQHRRTVSCSCGYSSYEYADHSIVNGSWTSASDTQHQRTNTCSCGYSATEYEDHDLDYGSWDWLNENQHTRTVACDCGYSGTETVDHTWIPGQWEAVDSQQHKRPLLCTCGETVYETADHTDTDDDGYCDDCDCLLTRFSVTIPASMALAMADNGEIYTATDVEIVNYSTGAVKVTGVTVTANGGWTIVPYNYNMAAAKVDSKQIGFAVNGAYTTVTGNTEALDLDGGWEIARGASLPLAYDAIVSATSQVFQAEQVLTLVFVIDWAAA